MTTAIARATAGSSQYQPRVARMTAPVTATPAGGGRIGSGINQDGLDVQVLIAVVIIEIAAHDDARR